MKLKLLILLLFLSGIKTYSQIDFQKRFQSNTRKYYTWNDDYKKYELRETEFENSVIDIREIGSKTNGYIVVSLVDNGTVRLLHGSIYEYSQPNKEQGAWLIRSKFMKAKLIYNPKENTMTYLYEADDKNKRYNKIMIFDVLPDEKPFVGLKSFAYSD